MGGVKDLGAAGEILGRLDAGSIRAGRGGERLDNGVVMKYSAEAVTPLGTDVTYVNRRTGAGLNVFEYGRHDFAFVMLHEHAHVQQGRGMTPYNVRAWGRAYAKNPAVLDVPADRFACANVSVTALMIFAGKCR
jgi:hypothetical protein